MAFLVHQIFQIIIFMCACMDSSTIYQGQFYILLLPLSSHCHSSFKIKNKESYFDLKGCMPHLYHKGLCSTILDKLGEVGGDEDGEDDCIQSAFYCLTDLCNVDNTAQVKCILPLSFKVSGALHCLADFVLSVEMCD